MRLDAHVVIVGGGVMGAATAWQLARRGVDVLLVERFRIGHAHGASHGTSRNFNIAAYTDPTSLAWLHEAARDWRELGRASGATILTRTGIVNHGTGREADVAAAITAGGFAAELLDPPAAAARWPGLRFTGAVLHTPEAGRLHADRAVGAFIAAARAVGARVVDETRVVGGSIEDDRATLLVQDTSGDETEIAARRVVVTAGAWTTSVLHTLGAVFALPPLRVTQEQPATFAALSPPDGWPGFNHAPTVDHPDTAWFPSGVYGMGVPGEGVKFGWHGVGPEVHPDRRSYLPDPELAALLRRYAREWVPGVDPDRAVDISCTYTSTPDSAFVFDRIGPVSLGAGFSGHGFKFAPTVGRMLADLATRGS